MKAQEDLSLHRSIVAVIVPQSLNCGYCYVLLIECELFGKEDLSAFPGEITKRSHTLHLEILDAPIGDEIFCNNFVAHKQSNVSFLLHQLQGLENPQVTLALLRKCAAV